MPSKKKDNCENCESINEQQVNEATETNNAELIEQIEQLKKELNDKNDSYVRLLAEYDNYKKRTIKEKSDIYLDTAAQTVSLLLPVIDNLERALDAKGDYESLKAGVALVLNQTLEAFASIDVKEIEAVDKVFDPNLHNAVMHIEDENVSENTIVEQFQKGYIMKDKVIRHSMVKVAN